MPLLLLQDTTRFCVSLLRLLLLPWRSDILWIVLLVAGECVALLKVTWKRGALVITLLWSVSGSISGLFSLILLSAWSRGSHLNVNEFVRSGYLGKRFLFEFAVIRGVGQILGISIGALVSISSAGAFRAAMTLFGPLNVLLNAVNAICYSASATALSSAARTIPIGAYCGIRSSRGWRNCVSHGDAEALGYGRIRRILARHQRTRGSLWGAGNRYRGQHCRLCSYKDDLPHPHAEVADNSRIHTDHCVLYRYLARGGSRVPRGESLLRPLLKPFWQCSSIVKSVT